MKVKELIKQLETCNQEKEFLVSCDEELNVLYEDFEVCLLTDEDKYCIFGLSGSEVGEVGYT